MEKEIDINGIKFINENELKVRDRTRMKLLSLLESIDEKTATPSMLEASARVAEQLLKL